jgi:uncharacterized protein with PIN domain
MTSVLDSFKVRGASALQGQLEQHARHDVRKSARAGNFAGRRLRTTFYRCRTCDDQLVAVQQDEVRAGQR